MKQTVYKLKKKTSGLWELPIEGISINRKIDGEDVGGRRIKYIPGAKTFWADDLPEKAKSEKVWFKKGFLFIPESDRNLTTIAATHPFLNLHYVLHDKEADAKRELESQKAMDEIINMISSSDKERIIATSLAVFGQSALTLTESEQELKLRKYAKEQPIKLKRELESKTYESKYIAALAFGKGVVRTNFGKTAIIWNDATEGEILKLARGESGISKLGELLSKRNEETDILLHAISEKIEKLTVNVPKETISDKDAELERLRKQLAELTAKKNNSGSDLKQLQKEYEEKIGKLPAPYKNNIEWIKGKLK